MHSTSPYSNQECQWSASYEANMSPCQMGIKDFQNLMWHKFEMQSIEISNYHDTMEYKWHAIQKMQ